MKLLIIFPSIAKNIIFYLANLSRFYLKFLTGKKPTKIFSGSPILNKLDLMRISVIELFSKGLDRFLTIKSQKFLSFFRYLYSENVREERDRPTKTKT